MLGGSQRRFRLACCLACQATLLPSVLYRKQHKYPILRLLVFHGRRGLSFKHLHLTPNVFEPARRKRGTTRRRVDRAMAKIGLQRSRITLCPLSPRVRLTASRAPFGVTSSGHKFRATIGADQHTPGRRLSPRSTDHRIFRGKLSPGCLGAAQPGGVPVRSWQARGSAARSPARRCRLQRWTRPFPRFLVYGRFSATARTR
jgi:hypothetical protein